MTDSKFFSLGHPNLNLPQPDYFISTGEDGWGERRNALPPPPPTPPTSYDLINSQTETEVKLCKYVRPILAFVCLFNPNLGPHFSKSRLQSKARLLDCACFGSQQQIVSHWGMRVIHTEQRSESHQSTFFSMKNVRGGIVRKQNQSPEMSKRQLKSAWIHSFWRAGDRQNLLLKLPSK